MIKFKTLLIVDFFKGAVLGLAKDQAQSRLHNLEKVKQGVYRVIFPVQFKPGEVVKLDDPDKVIRAKLECLEPEKEAAALEAKRAAAAEKDAEGSADDEAGE